MNVPTSPKMVSLQGEGVVSEPVKVKNGPASANKGFSTVSQGSHHVPVLKPAHVPYPTVFCYSAKPIFKRIALTDNMRPMSDDANGVIGG